MAKETEEPMNNEDRCEKESQDKNTGNDRMHRRHPS